MTLLELATKIDDPLGPEYRCRDFDKDCVDVPEIAPDGHIPTHLGCWLDQPECGWCPFLQHFTLIGKHTLGGEVEHLPGGVPPRRANQLQLPGRWRHKECEVPADELPTYSH
jgi:hypothetical protein